MFTPILATKLYIPPPRPHVVLRPRLIERLNEGLHRKLILISAPAGFGKTTLVSQWLVGCKLPAARICVARRRITGNGDCYGSPVPDIEVPSQSLTGPLYWNLYYAFFTAIEIACLLFIVWYAWTWRQPEGAVLTSGQSSS
jgi:hypothetical protein